MKKLTEYTAKEIEVLDQVEKTLKDYNEALRKGKPSEIPHIPDHLMDANHQYRALLLKKEMGL